MDELLPCKCGRSFHVINFCKDLTYNISCKCGIFLQHHDKYVLANLWNEGFRKLKPEEPMTNDDKDLKPCPFCGCSKLNEFIQGEFSQHGTRQHLMIECTDCHVFTQKKAWNTRATPQQPSEKKALSFDTILKIMHENRTRDYGGTSIEYKDFHKVAQAIHSAMPTQREVRYPQKRTLNVSTPSDYTNNGFNEAIDEFKKLNGDKN